MTTFNLDICTNFQFCKFCLGDIETTGEALLLQTFLQANPDIADPQRILCHFNFKLAFCKNCGAKYIAWIPIGKVIPANYSFRSTFNATAGDDDLPVHKFVLISRVHTSDKYRATLFAGPANKTKQKCGMLILSEQELRMFQTFISAFADKEFFELRGLDLTGDNSPDNEEEE